MQVLNNYDYKLYKFIISLSQKKLKKMLTSYLYKKYDTVISTKDFIYAGGEIPIALVAHLDTVWDKPPKLICYDKEQGIIWSPEGGCGDDRAGVFAILKILQSDCRPTIIFTTDEEKGGLGASALIQKIPKAPNPLNYIIELDRSGTNDCVFYDCENEEFTKYVESFGFVESIGTFSDIAEICPAWGMAGVNLSIGYEHEHSVSEIVRVPVLLQTIQKVKKMLKEENIPYFDFIPGQYFYNYYTMEFDGYKIKCDKCGKIIEPYEAIPIAGEKAFCSDCCLEGVDWCIACGQAFETDGTKSRLCPSCREKKNKKKKGKK